MIKLMRVYAIVAILNMFIFSAIYIFIPHLRQSLRYEDQFMQNLSAVLFFSSFLLSLILISTLKEKKFRGAPIAIPLIGLIGLIGFLDELSFGERMLDLTMPRIYGVKIDAVHDFVYLSYKVLKNHCNYLLYISALAAFCIVIFLIILKYHKYFDRISGLFKTCAPFRFILIFIGFISIAQIIDLDIVEYQFLFFIEELFEMNAALALLFALFSSHLSERQQGYLP